MWRKVAVSYRHYGSYNSYIGWWSQTAGRLGTLPRVRVRARAHVPEIEQVFSDTSYHSTRTAQARGSHTGM